MNSRNKGFTIVELLIVVVVIAILAAITIVAYNGIQNRAKASAAQSAAAQVSKKLALWQAENQNQSPTQAEVDSLTASLSSSTTLQYTSTGNGAYCATATTNGLSYFITNTGAAPQSGACFGHNNNGTTVITNLMMNPSFENSSGSWGSSGNGTTNYVTSGGLFGSRYLNITRTASAAIGLYGPGVDATPGEKFSGSASVRYPATRQAFLRFRWFDASNSVVGEPTSGVTVGTGNWQRLTHPDVTVPANATYGRFDIVMNAINAAAGDTLDVDGVMVTRGTSTYNYADGNSPGWSWQGTTNYSISSGPVQ